MIKVGKQVKWEIMFICFSSNEKRKYKVTRRLPGMSVAKTKIFSSKKMARKQFREWLKY